eukprot:SAG25_NODE_283_length_10420_cov_9.898382_12_plen_1182_part_00
MGGKCVATRQRTRSCPAPSESMMPGAAAVASLHDAISAARDGSWAEMERILFPAGVRALPDSLINTVPSPRSYGLLHQLAHWGAVDAYMALSAKGVVFDKGLLATDGQTALEVAVGEGHNEHVWRQLLSPGAGALSAPPHGQGGFPGGGAGTSEGVPSVRLWHGTTEECAMQMQRDGHLRASTDGFFGPGVYLTTNRSKAEAWAQYAAAGRPNIEIDNETSSGRNYELPPATRSTPGKPAVVMVLAQVGKVKEVNMQKITGGNSLNSYEEMHINSWQGFWGLGHRAIDTVAADDFGRVFSTPCFSAASTPSAIERFTGGAWRGEGFNSLHVDETSSLSGRCYHREHPGAGGYRELTGTSRSMYDQLGTRSIGDEWVVANESDAVYSRHELLPEPGAEPEPEPDDDEPEPEPAGGVASTKGFLLTLFDVIGAPDPGASVEQELVAAFPKQHIERLLFQAREAGLRWKERSGTQATDNEILAGFAYVVGEPQVHRHMNALLAGQQDGLRLQRTVYAHYEFLIRCGEYQLQTEAPRPIYDVWRAMNSVEHESRFAHLGVGDIATMPTLTECNGERKMAEQFLQYFCSQGLSGDANPGGLLHVLSREADASGMHAGVEQPREMSELYSGGPVEGEQTFPPLTALFILRKEDKPASTFGSVTKRYCEFTVEATYVPQIFAASLRPSETVWKEISEGGSAELERWLLDTPVVNLETPHDEYGSTLLYSAARFGNLAVVKALVNRCAHVDSQLSSAKSTALHAASFNGHVDVVQFLLNSHANFKLTNVYDLTAEQEAAAACENIFQQHAWCVSAAADADAVDGAAAAPGNKFQINYLHYGKRTQFLKSIVEYIGQRPSNLMTAVKSEFARDIKWTDQFADGNPDAYSASTEWSAAIDELQSGSLRKKLEAHEAETGDKTNLQDIELLALYLYTKAPYTPLNKFLRAVCDSTHTELELGTWPAFAWAILDAFSKLAPPMPGLVSDIQSSNRLERSDVVKLRTARAAAASLRADLCGLTVPQLCERAAVAMKNSTADASVAAEHAEELESAKGAVDPEAAIIELIVEATVPDPLPKLYRGVGMSLAPDFFIPDERGMVSAMEFAFASTSKKRSVADGFATSGGAAVVFEVTSCLRDAAGCHSGVDIEWISAVKSEKEVLFPPFTLFRVLGMAREGNLVTLQVCPTWIPWK